MKLIKVNAPLGKVDEDATSPVLNKDGWKYQGVYVKGEYYERATKGAQVQWFKLKDQEYA